MIFGFFGKKNDKDSPADDEEEEIDPIRFLGAINGKDANLNANVRLVDAGLVPAKDLLTDAVSRRAETVRIEPQGAQAKISLQIDGIAYPGGRLPKAEGMAVA